MSGVTCLLPIRVACPFGLQAAGKRLREYSMMKQRTHRELRVDMHLQVLAFGVFRIDVVIPR
jgi:hypothetical protein